tara:strand:+ start:115 stop:321 length:207 start_codon:yes stop_codon:yes gene_type:complete
VISLAEITTIKMKAAKAFQLSNKTKVEGDKNDEISLPQDAVQTSSDDLYLYYALNDNEIGISVDMILV